MGAIVSLGVIVYALKQPSEIISPLAEEVKAYNSTFPLTKQQPKSTDELLEQIRQVTEEQQGVYSVYIYDISQNKGFGFNETTIYTAASIIKLPILASLYYEAQKGLIDLDRRITIQTKDLQEYGTGVIRYEGPGGVYALKSLAQIMIEKSDNTAAYILTTLLTETRIQELVDSWGMIQTDIKNNKTSNKDMAELLVKMYKGQIANKALTQEMIGFLDDSDFENRLPARLPDDVHVYHKIGNEVGNIHDVGIVALARKPYYIGVMTNDVIDEPTTEKAIAEISKIVYEFENQR